MKAFKLHGFPDTNGLCGSVSFYGAATFLTQGERTAVFPAARVSMKNGQKNGGRSIPEACALRRSGRTVRRRFSSVF